jgi:hypothetical protein
MLRKEFIKGQVGLNWLRTESGEQVLANVGEEISVS